MEGYGLLDSYKRQIPGTKCQIEKALDVGEGYAVRLCHNVEDRARIRKIMEEEVRAGIYTQEFFDAIDTTYKDIVKDLKFFEEVDFSSISSDEVLAYFDHFYQLVVTTVHPMVLGIYASDLQDVFEAELKTALGNDANDEVVLSHTALLLTPTRLITVQKEEQRLFEIQDRFEHEYPSGTDEQYEIWSKQPDAAVLFDTLVTNLGWFHMEYLGEPRTAEEYQKQIGERIADLRKAGIEWTTQQSPKARLEELTGEQKAFFARHSDTALLQALVFTMQEYLIVLDFSKADLIEGLYYSRPLLAELGKRVGLDSWIDVRYLTLEELRAFIHEKRIVNKDYIRERKEYWTALLEDGVISLTYGREARELTDRILEKDEVTDTKEFKGLSAYPGVVRGIACVVTSAKDRDKFKQGQILVTVDTTTELTSIIKKSAAIVADQGGLLSHTAIVSREFKIPCIVRTKIGTKLVKDGDEIEVDAGKGIVRILNQREKILLCLLYNQNYLWNKASGIHTRKGTRRLRRHFIFECISSDMGRRTALMT